MIKITPILFLLLCFCETGFASPVEAAAMKDLKAAPQGKLQSIPEAGFREAFHNYLCRHLVKEKTDVIISKLKVAGNRPVPMGTISFQLHQKNKRRLKEHITLTAVIRIDGVVKNRVSISGWVQVFESVVYTSCNLKRGEVLKEDNLYLERRNIARRSEGILIDIGKAVGLRTKHNLKADTCLKEWMLEKPPVVDRGDMVMILAESGALRITVPGKILQKGYVGELVEVQNSMSKKNIYAKVINSSTVVVDF